MPSAVLDGLPTDILGGKATDPGLTCGISRDTGLRPDLRRWRRDRYAGYPTRTAVKIRFSLAVAIPNDPHGIWQIRP